MLDQLVEGVVKIADHLKLRVREVSQDYPRLYREARYLASSAGKPLVDLRELP